MQYEQKFITAPRKFELLTNAFFPPSCLSSWSWDWWAWHKYFRASNQHLPRQPALLFEARCAETRFCYRL